MKKTYIILLNYNGWRDTQECLESLLKLDYHHYRIVVVDNNSSDHSMEHLLSWAKGDEVASVGLHLSHLSISPSHKPLDYALYNKEDALRGGVGEWEDNMRNPIVFIQAGENRGFAAGNNIGIQYAINKGDAHYIWCLNNDTVVEPNALTHLVNKSKHYQNKGKKVGIIGAKLMYYHQPCIIQAVGGKYNKWLGMTKHVGALEEDTGQYDRDDVSSCIDYIIGASMFVDIRFVNDVGLMCEDYFLYFEELDWLHRGNRKGWNIGYCWQTKVFHKEGASIGTSVIPGKQSVFAEYYLLRSRLKFAATFYPKNSPFVRLGLLLIFINRLRRFHLKKSLQVFGLLFMREE